MKYEEFKRVITGNWWCKGDPRAWVSENPGIGIGLMAQDGQVGCFNLCWLMLQRVDPPPLKVYQQIDLNWVIRLAGLSRVQGRSLLEHASFKTLDEFNALVLAHTKERKLVDRAGNVPWGTLRSIAEKSLTCG